MGRVVLRNGSGIDLHEDDILKYIYGRGIKDEDFQGISGIAGRGV